jgi:hypothetical protein
MDVVRPDAVLNTVKPAGGEAAAASSKGGPPFDEVMKGVEAGKGGDKPFASLEVREYSNIAPPNEHGSGKGELKPTVPVDLAGQGLDEIADKLGA